jgi:hypothetical protein
MTRLTVAVAWLVLLAACSKAPETPVAPPVASPQIEWIHPTAASDIDGAFARARQESRPLYLFWTAAWCPPCSQVKSTIFVRPDFIEKSRSFVPVYVDGDSTNGQLLGRRFSVTGYPTMVLLRPDGSEITRLAGSIDADKYMQLLDQGLAGGSSARQALTAVLAGETVGAEDWRMLAYYSWDVDDQQLVKTDAVPTTMLQLAQRCPPQQRESASRLTLQAIAAAAKDPKKAAPLVAKADALASLQSILASPDLARVHYDLIVQHAATFVEFTTAAKSAERRQLEKELNAVLDRLAADATLSNAARVWAVSAKVDIARVGQKLGTLPQPLLAQVREQAAWADHATPDVEERQSVITAAGAMLADAGLLDESDALLSAELTRSHSPYYYMLGLASNARQRKTPAGNAAAIDWARQAYETSKGPATRLQWGGAYVNTLIELAPTDTAGIEAASAGIIDEAARTPDAYAGRSRRSLERLSQRLQKWNRNGSHDAILARLHVKMADICASSVVEPADRSDCTQLFTPGKHA